MRDSDLPVEENEFVGRAVAHGGATETKLSVFESCPCLVYAKWLFFNVYFLTQCKIQVFRAHFSEQDGIPGRTELTSRNRTSPQEKQDSLSTSLAPAWSQLGTRLVLGTNSVSSWYQLRYQLGTNLAPTWYQLGAKLVPAWYQVGNSSGLTIKLF